MRSIRIPTVPRRGRTTVEVRRGSIRKRGKATQLQLKNQIICGVEIPVDYIIHIPGKLTDEDFRNGSSLFYDLPNWKLNQILRTLYLDTLRFNPESIAL